MIAMSAYTDYEYIRQAMKNGAVDYLLKPCRRKEILGIFEKVERQKKERAQETEEKQRERRFLKLLKGNEDWQDKDFCIFPEGKACVCTMWSDRDRGREEWEAVMYRSREELRKKKRCRDRGRTQTVDRNAYIRNGGGRLSGYLCE